MKQQKIELQPHNKIWLDVFQREKENLEKICKGYISNIYHVGSTSIKDIHAKPKIDIILALKDIFNFDFKILEKINYEVKGQFNIPMRIYAAKYGDFKINLHIVNHDNPNIDLMKGFRDFISEDDDLKKEYEDLKISISYQEDANQKDGNIGLLNNYNLRKNEFIIGIIERMNLGKIYARFCSHYKEFEYLTRFISKDFIDNHKNSNDHKFFIFYKDHEIIGFSYVKKNNEERYYIDILMITNKVSQEKITCEKIINQWINFNKLNLFDR